MSTGVYLDAPAQICIVPDHASYQLLARGKNTLVEFSDAFYSSLEQRIYVRNANEIWSNYGNILIHEYTHWYLDQILRDAPLWFHEGLATRHGNQLGVDRYLYYVRERFWGNRLDLIQYAYDYPRQKQDWELYYLTSFFAVQYLQDKDADAWRGFWSSVAEQLGQGRKARFGQALVRGYGMDLYAFSRDFAAASKRQAWIYLFTGFGSLLFLALPFLLIYATIRNRRRLASLPDLPLPEEEPPEPDAEAEAPGDAKEQ